ncbi:porin family protein [Dyella mobilis]|uniref:Porin family protein n=1 Tax=Dyella mobilis TaxID=1849582 RepID=A0ABS2KLE2_9GAMM|nr:porin family protein [Dyella mobilis]
MQANQLFTGSHFSSPFSGLYVGAKAGANVSDATGRLRQPSHTSFFPGVTVGFGFDAGPIMLGGEAFADFHHGSTTRKDAGFDGKLGVPIDGRYMPYLRIGATSQWPDSRLHYGFGVEYKALRSFGVAAEWTADKSNANGIRRHNNSFTLGVHYYFQ